MKKAITFAFLTHVILTCTLTSVLAQTPTPASSTAQATPTPTLGDNFTQVLPDRRVTFRLLAPKANAVQVVIGIKSGPYEAQGTTTAEMTKNANGLWTTTLGPLEPNLYEYNFMLDGRKITDPGNDIAREQFANRDHQLGRRPFKPSIRGSAKRHTTSWNSERSAWTKDSQAIKAVFSRIA